MVCHCEVIVLRPLLPVVLVFRDVGGLVYARDSKNPVIGFIESHHISELYIN